MPWFPSAAQNDAGENRACDKCGKVVWSVDLCTCEPPPDVRIAAALERIAELLEAKGRELITLNLSRPPKCPHEVTNPVPDCPVCRKRFGLAPLPEGDDNRCTKCNAKTEFYKGFVWCPECFPEGCHCKELYDDKQ